MATMKDVAKLAGVSLGTVSNIINGSQSVSLDKIVRVENAMKELGYIPNKLAKGLRSTENKHVVVILPNVSDFAMAQLFTSIASSMRDKGYSVSLYITNGMAELEMQYITESVMTHVAGIVLVTCQPENTDFFKEVISNGTKMVFVLRMVKDLDVNFISFDIKEIMKEFMLMQKENHVSKVYLLCCSRNFTFDAMCAEKFVEYGKEFLGINLSDNIYRTNYSKESAFKEMIMCLEGEEEKTALLCTNSLLAIGANKAVQVLDLQNVKIHVFDTMTWSLNKRSDVIRMELPYMELGDNAADMLYESLCNPVFEEDTQKLFPIENVNLKNTEKINENSVKADVTLRILMLKNVDIAPSYALFSEFERDTGIKVEITMKSYQELYDEIIQSHEEGKYDIYEVDLPWMAYLASQGIITELHEVDENCEQYLGDVVKKIIPAYTQYKGKTYAFPYMYCSQLLFYRKDLFEDIKNKRMFFDTYKTELQPPRNWNEFNAVAKFFTREYNPTSDTLYGTTAGGCVDNGAVCEFLPRYWSYGGEIIKDGKPYIDEKSAIKALSNYKESFKYAPPGSEKYWWDEQCRTFCDGDTAMMILYNAHAADIVNRRKSKIAGRVGFSIIPGQTSVIGGWSLAIDSKSQLKKEALEFMKWTCSEEISIMNTILGGCSPVEKIYRDTEISTVYPWHKEMLDVYKYSKLRNFPDSTAEMGLENRKVELKMGELVHEALIDKLEVAEAVKRLKEYVEELNIG